MENLLSILLVLFCLALPLYLVYYQSPRMKGKRGERRVAKLLDRLPADYHTLHDVVLETNKGTTQIDHLVVSKFGLFAIETKNYRGEIYGDDQREHWTQILVTKVRYKRNWFKVYTYVTKNQFYNPVKQSRGHAFQVKMLLHGYRSIPVAAIVVFVGKVSLKHVVSRSPVLHDWQLLSFIRSHQIPYRHRRGGSPCSRTHPAKKRA